MKPPLRKILVSDGVWVEELSHNDILNAKAGDAVIIEIVIERQSFMA